MKKLFLFAILSILFFGCASTGNGGAGSFRVEYNDVKDVTYIVHSDMEIPHIYNLRDNLAGERENVRVYIANENLFFSVNYQYKRWGFFKKAVFLSNGERLVIELPARNGHVVYGAIVREQYDTILTDNEIETLYKFVSSGSVDVAFIGDYTTDKMKMDKDTLRGFVATFEKYKELKK